MNNKYFTANKNDNPLLEWIRVRLRAGGGVNFAQFMEWALYHPEFGYYSVGPEIGPRGDFTTSPEASPAFGQLLAVHALEIDSILGHPSPFHLIECGPGRGTLALDLLDLLSSSYPDLYGRIRYWLVEISPGLVEAQKARLLLRHGGVVAWAANLDELPRGLTGSLLANEVLDAFPVHVLENHGGIIVEHFVDVAPEGDLQIVYKAASDPRLLDHLEQYRIGLAPGQKVEVNLASREWIALVSSVLGCGLVTVVDYGDMSPQRYSESRKEGTLLGYYGGSVTDSVLANPGKQDLTALVDFTDFKRTAIDNGFSVVGFTRQANFLLGLGLGTTIGIQSENTDLSAALTNRRGLHALVNPEGLGKFRVLMLAKGLDAERTRAQLSGMKYADAL